MEANTGVKRWQDVGNLLIGIWLLISPIFIQYPSDVPNAAWNAYALGVAIAIFAACAVYMPRAWEEGINVLLGLWMIAAPWVLKFASYKDAAMNAVIVGVLVVILAAWAMARDKNFEKWRHDRPVAH